MINISHQKKGKKTDLPNSTRPNQETNSRSVTAGRTYSGYEIIKIAIEEEKEGFNFYKKMMGKSLSSEVKEVFHHLLHEEEKHLVF